MTATGGFAHIVTSSEGLILPRNHFIVVYFVRLHQQEVVFFTFVESIRFKFQTSRGVALTTVGESVEEGAVILVGA